MERTPVSSTSLRSIGYDPDSSFLDVEFHSGAVYRYLGVPEREYEALLRDDSHGGYFNANIRDRYPFIRLREPD
jgi:hypothetical protein